MFNEVDQRSGRAWNHTWKVLKNEIFNKTQREVWIRVNTVKNQTSMKVQSTAWFGTWLSVQSVIDKI